jgi:signal transduction histidine kinase
MTPEGIGADAAQEEIAALRAQLAQAQEAVRARDEFLAIAAHELRNPMHTATLASGALLALAVRKGDTELERLAARTYRAMASLGRQSTLLLDVSRLNAGRFALRPVPLDLVACVGSVLDELREQAMHLGCELSYDAPAQILGGWDPQAIAHLVGNLVGNAIKYGAGHPVHVSLAAGPGSVLLTVRDQGPGIAPDAQRRIFEKFERLVATPMATEGFGLGLWIVGRIVQAHDGRIEVHSEPGQGSSFAVTLPRG